MIKTPRRTACILAALLCWLPLSAQSSTSAEWELAREEDNIRLYTRQVEGSDFMAIRASTVMSAHSDAVAAALGDGEGCAAWRTMCKSSRVLEVVSERERLVYMILDLPWPISDRDVVMRSTTTINPETRTAIVSLQSDSDVFPPQKQVRAECNGQFVIQVIDDQKVEVAYEMHADLGGQISADMVKSRQLASTHKEMLALRELVER